MSAPTAEITMPDGTVIKYRHIRCDPNPSNCTVVFLPGAPEPHPLARRGARRCRRPPPPARAAGLLSCWDGVKGLALEAAAASMGCHYLTLHYRGHGAGAARSGGALDDVTRLQQWVDDVLGVLRAVRHTHPESRFILVGSSLGGWLALLAALPPPETASASAAAGAAAAAAVAGLLLLAPAVDASRRWAATSAADAASEGPERAEDPGFVTLPSAYVDGGGIRLRRALVADANARHVLLEGPGRERLGALRRIPVRVLHGERDDVVPVEAAKALAAALAAAGVEDVELHVAEEGDHRLSRPQDVARMGASLQELVARAAGRQPPGRPAAARCPTHS
jgi:alpha-beta hydrolase superfamily lysophospholipase